ncbi:Doublecortin domain-containing protein 5 [Acipenser ruthenus]|uniref:Doublecortin domain-containing protein 5 n=1 Tax=Acipenser ruthenus TaxID=7906 RepID=A0A444U992_ACIRT|nr:Doublecortin domain-containing protein 5 [Acipenser ruthenus]
MIRRAVGKTLGFVGYTIQYGCIAHCAFEYIGELVMVLQYPSNGMASKRSAGASSIGSRSSSTSYNGSMHSRQSSLEDLLVQQYHDKLSKTCPSPQYQLPRCWFPLLEECTVKLNLNTAARRVFLLSGEEAHEPKDIPHDAEVYISTGEPFVDPFKKIKDHLTLSKEANWTVNGVVLPADAKRGTTKPSLSLRMRKLSEKTTVRILVFKNGAGQDGCEVIAAVDQTEKLDYALDNNTEKVTKKEILSMTMEELYNNKEEVDQLIDELRDAIKKHKGQLSKLALQLQAEEEQCAGYVYQHIKQLSTSSSDPQGLQLKVYENGQDTEETVVYINRKLMEKGCGKDVQLMMDRLLQIVGQRLQSSQMYNPSGLNLFPTRLFDEQGQEICNPCSLQNEQKVWVSYGEDYRWEAFIGFPENYSYEQQGSHHQQEDVDLNSHFIQLKEDLQMVLYASVTMENRSRKATRKKDNQNQLNAAAATTWPLAHVWMVTKEDLQMVLYASVTMENRSRKATRKKDNQNQLNAAAATTWPLAHVWMVTKAYSEFVLTYLEELNVREEVTQTEKHHGAWSTEGPETGCSSANEDSGYNASDTTKKQVPKPIDTQSMPPGARRESIQLTVALVRKLEDKHPKASAQRWAMRHEGTARLGQWKQSQVGNPLWNKLTYMWPVLPDGELNEDFNWPLEGSLIPNAPPLKKPASKKPDGYTPVRLQVLRNGHKDHFKAVTITGPDITNMLKKNRKPAAKQTQKENVEKDIASEEDRVIKIHSIEFQQFLERCTVLLNLPFAARRLFDKEGNEITLLTDTVRDQLVFVSCGEQWIDPQLTMAERRKRMILNNLESDISQIRNYCAMRSNGGLVLEIVDEVAEGARLIVNECDVTSEEEHNEDSTQSDGQPEKKENKVNDDIVSEVLHHSKPLKIQQIHRQQFEFSGGHIINCKFPRLVLGVLGEAVQSGTEIQLMEKKPDDVNQRWIFREEDRTFHLMSNPGLVLAVSMPKIRPGDTDSAVQVHGCSVVLQKYKSYSYGVANQKWHWIPEAKVLSAFYTTEMDQEITAANQASLCTFSVSGTEEIDQQGFSFTHSSKNRKMTVCSACARALRGKSILTKLPPGASFYCATGWKKSQLKPTGPFKSLSVIKVFVSCGEQWIDPQLTMAERRKRMILNNLESDISQIRNYCAMRSNGGLVLEIVDEVAEGARLIVNECDVTSEEEHNEDSTQSDGQPEKKENKVNDDIVSEVFENSHTKAHRKIDERHTSFKYPWQNESRYLDENENDLHSATGEEYTNMELYNKYRCTVLLNLPFAARRLFDKEGNEITLLTDTVRDQLVFVSCGEQWIDPQLTMAERRKRMILNNLESDISQIRNYCAMRSNGGLVLEIVDEVAEGARLIVNECDVTSEEEHNEDSTQSDGQPEKKENKVNDDIVSEVFENSHTKAHRKIDERYTSFKYPWQNESRYLDENENDLHSATGEEYTNMELYNKYRTFHLMSNPGLVLAVSMPKIRPGDTDSAVQVHGCSVVLQKYKSYSYGVANQKWHWIPEAKVLSAFYTTEMDQEITAANQASLCTFSVSGTEEIDQQGFSFTHSSKNRKMTVCSACARALRGKSILTKLPPGASFYCATGWKKSQLKPTGPFKSLSVIKTDLSTSEAENTLKYFEEVLASLRKETSIQVISQEISAARMQRPVKIKAYRNGAGFKDGQLITATTMPMLLSMCTSRLELSRAACRLYTVNGTPMQTASDLIAWAVNDCLQESSMEEQKDTEDTDLITKEVDDVTTDSLELSANEKAASRSQLLLRVTVEELGSLDETLLTLILRNPIDVWVSSGEPFLPLHVLQQRERQQKMNWKQKEKVLADLVLKRHKMRLLQGRRMGALKPGRMISTKSSIQPVVVEGGWTEPSQEEVKLMEDVQNMEVHLSEVQAIQSRKRSSFLKTIATNPRDLYNQPDVKRVLVHMNGTDPKQGVFAWGKNMEELLGSCTSRLNMRQPAQVLYAMDGAQLSTWDEIERDMLICVSSGEPFMSTKANRHKIEIRANYARVRKDKGPAATDIVVTPKGNPKVKVEAPSNLLALPAASEHIF